MLQTEMRTRKMEMPLSKATAAPTMKTHQSRHSGSPKLPSSDQRGDLLRQGRQPALRPGVDAEGKGEWRGRRHGYEKVCACSHSLFDAKGKLMVTAKMNLCSSVDSFTIWSSMT